MPSHRRKWRHALKQLLRSFRGTVSAVVQYVTSSPDALDEVCAPEGAMLHPRKQPIRRKARVITESRLSRVYQMETQREMGVVCDAEAAA